MKKIYKDRKTMLRWRLIRNAEKKRKNKSRMFNMYKNKYFIQLICDATRVEYWKDFDTKRMKLLRNIIEVDYDVPINYFCSFVYYSTYRYMNWQNRDLNFQNYIGFLSSEFNLTNFANYLLSRNLSWRFKNSKWPEDFTDKWGLKLSIKGQKLGRKDKLIRHDIMSTYVKDKIGKYL